MNTSIPPILLPPSLYERIEIENLHNFTDTGLSIFGSFLCPNLLRDLGDLPRELIRRVELGSHWLHMESLRGTFKGRRWEKQVDIHTLSLRFGDRCLLAQVAQRPYSVAMDDFRLTLDDVIRKGFHPGGPVQYTDTLSYMLTLLWLGKIKVNRAIQAYG